MTDANETDMQMLEVAKSLVTALEKGDKDEADRLLTDIADLRESSLFQELGKLTREFHSALNSFRFDERISSMAKEEIPDAKERLNYVITKTEEAANKTLNAIESVVPMCEEMAESTSKLGEQWTRFTRRELGPAEFRSLSNELLQHFGSSGGKLVDVKLHLNDVLMAQDFQDITGQIIKRVIALVGDVEKSLVELIKLGGGVAQSSSSSKKTSDPSALEGPQVPGLESETVVSGQDDVDDLLSSLGF